MKCNFNFNFNGKSFNSFEEMAESIKNDPNSDTIVWDYQDHLTTINGKPVYNGTSKGRCHWHGKTFEGFIEERDGKLYVGGEYVKDI